MKMRAEELIAILVLSVLTVVALLCGIEYLLTFHSLITSYGNVTNTVFKFLGPIFVSELKKSNTSSYATNASKFYEIYFSLNGSEMAVALNQINAIEIELNNLSRYALGSILFSIFYLFLYFGGLCDKISRKLTKTVFGTILFILNIIIVPSISGFSGLIVVAAIPDVFSTLLYSQTNLGIPLGVIVSIPEILIFGLDLTMLLVLLISEYAYKISENLTKKIETFISNHDMINRDYISGCIGQTKYISSIAYLFNILNDTLSILIKILVIITLGLSISISILAYYNIAFLAFDVILFISAISILISFTSGSLGLDMVLYFLGKALEAREFIPKLF